MFIIEQDWTGLSLGVHSYTGIVRIVLGSA